MAHKVSLHSTNHNTVRSIEIDGSGTVSVKGIEWTPQFSVVSLMSPAVEKTYSVPGAYILVAPIADKDGRFPIYVGKSTTGGLGKRLKNHVDRVYSQAVVLPSIVVRGKENRITQDQASALEYFFHEEFNAQRNKGINLANESGISVGPLHPSEMDAYRQFAKIASEIVKLLLGVGLDKPVSDAKSRNIVEEYIKRWGADAGIVPSGKDDGDSTGQENNRDDITLANLIEGGLIKVGTRLVAKSGKHLREAKIYDRSGKIQLLRYGMDGNWVQDLSYSAPIICDSLNQAKNLKGTKDEMVVKFGAWTFWVLESDPTTSMEDLRNQFVGKVTSEIKAITSRRPPRFSKLKLSDLVADDVVGVGEWLESTWEKYPAEARIASNTGSIHVVRFGKDSNGNWINDDQSNSFESPSGAANFVVRELTNKGQGNVDGWRFWRLATGSKMLLKKIRDDHERS